MRPVLVVLLAVMTSAPACHNPRPAECQRLRQCCAVARAGGGEAETVRVVCMRKDDSDATQCRQSLEQLRSDVPGLADNDECKTPQP